jgi:hypothetical protein
MKVLLISDYNMSKIFEEFKEMLLECCRSEVEVFHYSPGAPSRFSVSEKVAEIRPHVIHSHIKGALTLETQLTYGVPVILENDLPRRAEEDYSICISMSEFMTLRGLEMFCAKNCSCVISSEGAVDRRHSENLLGRSIVYVAEPHGYEGLREHYKSEYRDDFLIVVGEVVPKLYDSTIKQVASIEEAEFFVRGGALVLSPEVEFNYSLLRRLQSIGIPFMVPRSSFAECWGVPVYNPQDYSNACTEFIKAINSLDDERYKGQVELLLRYSRESTSQKVAEKYLAIYKKEVAKAAISPVVRGW